MARFTPMFTMGQFGSQTLFLLTVSGLSFALEMSDLQTARMSQAIATAICPVPFLIGWRCLPPVKARNKLEEGKSIIWQGFARNWNTAKLIRRDYGRSLKWFLIGASFSEPAAGAFTTVSVVFLMDHLEMSSAQVGMVFFLVLTAMIPGGLIAKFLAIRTNANTTVRLSLFAVFGLSVFGALGLTPDNVNPVAYIWAFCLGLALGTYYPSLKLFLSFVIPKSREAEVVGFYVNCSQLLSWLPPLVFSGLVEAGVDIGIGLMVMGCFALIAIVFFSMAAPFDELLDEVRFNDKHNVTEATRAAAVEVGRSSRCSIS